MKGTHKHKEASLICFDNPRCLSQSEKSNVSVHIHLLTSGWERHLWLSKCIGQSSTCLCVPFNQRSLHFLGKSFLFLFLFLCYPYFVTFPFHMVSFDTIINSYKYFCIEIIWYFDLQQEVHFQSSKALKISGTFQNTI